MPCPPGEPIDTDWLGAYLSKALRIDDVLRKEFLTTILLTSNDSTTKLELDQGTDLATSFDIQSIKHASSQDLIPGPYMIVGGDLWQVLRLYQDLQGAFLAPVRKSTRGGYEQLIAITD